MLSPRPAVYETYWRFAFERQEIFYRRLLGGKPPYTDDPILAEYKFCNVYRAADRVSQCLIGEVLYARPTTPQDTLFRAFLFRLLNKCETWRALEQALGEPVSLKNFTPGRYASLLEGLREGGPIYGNAFILCANKAFGFDEKHRNHMALLEYAFLTSDWSARALASMSLGQLFETLRELPLIGDFMAYQIAIDFNYSEAFDFDENDFTIAGPGARRGIAKCFADLGGMTETDAIMWMVENQDAEFARLGLPFRRLGTRPLKAIDCQGLFCETDKYCRVAFPELASNRTRIKASFVESPRQLDYVFPPKWSVRLEG